MAAVKKKERKKRRKRCKRYRSSVMKYKRDENHNNAIKTRNRTEGREIKKEENHFLFPKLVCTPLGMHSFCLKRQNKKKLTVNNR